MDPATTPHVHYPVADDVGESTLQLLIRSSLWVEVSRWLAERGTRAFVGSDQFVYWVEGDPTACVAPDVYVVPGLDPAALPPSLKLWEMPGPSFALEVASDDFEKDYVDNPPKYDAIGVDELVVHDPDALDDDRGRRIRWQVYRRVKQRFVLVHQGGRDRVRSAVLGCWLRVVPDALGRPVIRLARDPAGDVVVPTADEVRAALEAEVARLRKLLG